MPVVVDAPTRWVWEVRDDLERLLPAMAGASASNRDPRPERPPP